MKEENHWQERSNLLFDHVLHVCRVPCFRRLIPSWDSDSLRDIGEGIYEGPRRDRGGSYPCWVPLYVPSPMSLPYPSCVPSPISQNPRLRGQGELRVLGAGCVWFVQQECEGFPLPQIENVWRRRILSKSQTLMRPA